MDTTKFTVVIERDEDGVYIASVPTLPGCHTQAHSLDDLMARTKEAIELVLEYQKDSAEHVRVNFVGLQEIEVEA